MDLLATVQEIYNNSIATLDSGKNGLPYEDLAMIGIVTGLYADATLRALYKSVLASSL